tara:strand:+ start:226 stop:651 length:426 start_codon:yes stop_codon:yes gene_type:complete
MSESPGVKIDPTVIRGGKLFSEENERHATSKRQTYDHRQDGEIQPKSQKAVGNVHDDFHEKLNIFLKFVKKEFTTVPAVFTMVPAYAVQLSIARDRVVLNHKDGNDEIQTVEKTTDSTTTIDTIIDTIRQYFRNLTLLHSQ